MAKYSADKLIKYLPIFYTGLTILFVTIAWLVWKEIDINVIKDTPNLVALILETGIGIAITITIFVYSKRQGDNLEKMTGEVQKFVKKQNKLIDDTRDVYASAYVMWVHHIALNFEHVINLYNTKYSGQPIDQSRENVRKLLQDYYDRDLTTARPKIETMELVKVFGKELADTVWVSVAHLQANEWQSYSDEGMALMINDYKDHAKKAVELKEIFLTFCDEKTKLDDQRHNEQYDKIKTTR